MQRKISLQKRDAYPGETSSIRRRRASFSLRLFTTTKARAGRGARFTAAVEEATAWAVAFPLTGSPATKNTRLVFIKDSPFAVVYRPTPDGIVVFALAHHSRQPGYWQSRVQDR
jgi:hypothetical protein